MDVLAAANASNASSLVNGTADDELYPMCPPTEPYDQARVVLVLYVGTAVAGCGIVGNALLVALFCGDKYRHGPALYLALLALFDVLNCCNYLLLFSGDFIWVYYKNELVYHLWHHYTLPVYACSKIYQFASTFLVVCATSERFLLIVEKNAWTEQLSVLYSPFARKVTILIVIVCAVLTRGVTYFEYTIEPNPDCNDTVFEQYSWQYLLAAKEWYIEMNWYVVPVVCVYLPFCVLVLLNLAMICCIKKRMNRERRAFVTNGTEMLQRVMQGAAQQAVGDRANPKQTDEHQVALCQMNDIDIKRNRNRVKTATITMAALVVLYLVCNLLDLCVKVIERTDSLREMLFQKELGPGMVVSTPLYIYATDMVSILVVVNSMLRVFIYSFSDSQIRADLWTIVRCRCPKPPQVKPCTSSDGENGSACSGGGGSRRRRRHSHKLVVPLRNGHAAKHNSDRPSGRDGDDPPPPYPRHSDVSNDVILINCSSSDDDSDDDGNIRLQQTRIDDEYHINLDDSIGDDEQHDVARLNNGRAAVLLAYDEGDDRTGLRLYMKHVHMHGTGAVTGLVEASI